jgi:photosystem II stability/assembly factor-like uncharacterized protein
VSDDPRLANADVAADPISPDVVYAAGASGLRSADGGRTWASWRADSSTAPYHRVWIHPTQPDIAVLASARGAAVTVNRGETWTDAAGQSTATLSQVIADNAFPYRVCAGHPAGGLLCVASGGRAPGVEWSASRPDRPGFVAVDPTDPEIVYAGEVRRHDRRTGQVLDVSPPGRPSSSPAATAPLLFSSTTPRTLYFASTTLWASTTGGQTWSAISPDVQGDAASSPGGRRAISAIGLSSIDGRVIWIGTDTGHVRVTRDQGATWRDVTPAGLPASGAVIALEASHYDTSTAYATLSVDEGGRQSRVLRTRDAGVSWTDVTQGLGAGNVHVVREDSARRGLLFAAGDDSVLVSFDDGDSWRSLRLNLPPVPVRDLVVKDADLIAATAGRGLWVLDDVSPLRQITADVLKAPAFLFRPAAAWRTRPDTSLSAVESGLPGAAAAPEGVAITYALGDPLTDRLVLEIVEGAAGDLVRRYASDDPGSAMSRAAGLHRVQWDLRHTPPPLDWLTDTPSTSRPSTALRGRWVLPGTFQVRLMTGRATLRQAILVRLDPRVRTSAADLAIQTRLTRSVEETLTSLAASARAVRDRQSILPSAPISTSSTAILSRLREAGRDVARMFDLLQQADARPTAATEAAVTDVLTRARAAIADVQ